VFSKHRGGSRALPRRGNGRNPVGARGNTIFEAVGQQARRSRHAEGCDLRRFRRKEGGRSPTRDCLGEGRGEDSVFSSRSGRIRTPVRGGSDRSRPFVRACPTPVAPGKERSAALRSAQRCGRGCARLGDNRNLLSMGLLPLKFRGTDVGSGSSTDLQEGILTGSVFDDGEGRLTANNGHKKPRRSGVCLAARPESYAVNRLRRW
jgi:hypothetical protein